MTRIDRYMLSQFLTQFGFFALVLVSVYWINRAVQLFEQLIQDGQTALAVHVVQGEREQVEIEQPFTGLKPRFKAIGAIGNQAARLADSRGGERVLVDLHLDLTLDAVRRLPVTHTGALLRAFAERWQVARLLDGGGKSYREIAAEAHASPTTPSHISSTLPRPNRAASTPIASKTVTKGLCSTPALRHGMRQDMTVMEPMKNRMRRASVARIALGMVRPGSAVSPAVMPMRTRRLPALCA